MVVMVETVRPDTGRHCRPVDALQASGAGGATSADQTGCGSVFREHMHPSRPARGLRREG